MSVGLAPLLARELSLFMPAENLARYSGSNKYYYFVISFIFSLLLNIL